MSGKEAQEAATTPTAGNKQDSNEGAEKPLENQHAEQQTNGNTNKEVDLGPPSSTEEDATRAAEAEAEANGTTTGPGGDGSGRPKLPRPKGIQPCPRCSSTETKFCYYNNYNIKQPRYYCKGCQRYWTAGGTLRDVPVGAGRRRSKGARSQDDTLSGGGGFSAGTLPPYVDPAFAAITLAAAAAAKPNSLLAPGIIPPIIPPVIPPVIPVLVPPAIIPTLPFPAPVNYSQLAPIVEGGTSVQGGNAEGPANASLADPAEAAAALELLHQQHQHHPGALAAKTNVTVNQRPQMSEASDDGAVEGRRTKRTKTGAGVDNAEAGNHNRNSNKNNNHANSKFTATTGCSTGGCGGGGTLPMQMPPYSTYWFAAQQNPQAAVAMQAQLQAATAAGYVAPPPYAVPGMWPGYGYGGFPPTGWPNPTAAAAAYQAAATGTTTFSRGGSPVGANGDGIQQELPPGAPPAMPGRPWMAPQWPPAMVIPPCGMPPSVAMPPGLVPPMPQTAAAPAAAKAPAPTVTKTNMNKNDDKKTSPSGNAN